MLVLQAVTNVLFPKRNANTTFRSTTILILFVKFQYISLQPQPRGLHRLGDLGARLGADRYGLALRAVLRILPAPPNLPKLANFAVQMHSRDETYFFATKKHFRTELFANICEIQDGSFSALSKLLFTILQVTT